MRVSIAIALPGRQEVIDLELAAGSTVADAIAAAGLGKRFPGLDVGALQLGIWSREVEPSATLRDGDRVEIYRKLKADPKDMRRARARAKPSPRSRSGS
jgi:uncharacterized protein